MKTEYTIKNFRAFDENGATVDFKPITILTGTNGSGKSSIVKSLVLFDTYRHSLLKDEEEGKWFFSNHKLDFNKSKAKNLGSYQSVLNKNSESKTIEYSFSTYSVLFGGHIKMSFVFEADERDMRKMGEIQSVSFYTMDGELLYSISNDPQKVKCVYQRDYNLLRYSFLRFVSGLNYLSTKEVSEDPKKQTLSFDKEFGTAHLKEIENWKHDHINDYNWHRAEISMDFRTRNKSKRIVSLFDNVLTKEDGEVLLQKLINYGVLFYYPILDILFPLGKKDFVSKIGELTKGNILKENVSFALNKMIDDFQRSENETFWEYYKSKEEQFLRTPFDNISSDFDSYIDAEKMTIQVSPFSTSYLISTNNSWNYQKRISSPDYEEWMDNSDQNDTLDLRRWEDATENCNFTLVTDVIMNLDMLLGVDTSNMYDINEDLLQRCGYDSGMRHHRIWSCFHYFVHELLDEVTKKTLSKRLSYLDSTVMNVKRMYPLDADDDFTKLLNRYFDAQSSYLKRWGKEEDKKGLTKATELFLSHWIQRFKLGYSSRINVDDEGLVATIKIFKEEHDEKGRFLSEEGYGVTQLFTILLRIMTAIIETMVGSRRSFRLWKSDEKYFWKCYDGFFKWEESIALEEPEVHLHPRFQSMLAELFVFAYKVFGVHFVIETHSEYIIRKLQLLVAENKIDHDDISIQYVYDSTDRPKHKPKIKNIHIRKDGMLDGTFGSGFFDEADMLSMYLLTSTGNNNG